MTTLTEKFNTAIVKKGDIFQVDLPVGLPVGDSISVKWDVQVTSGKATLLKIQVVRPRCEPSIQRREFRAEEAGEIEIVAKEKTGRSVTFKVKVN